MTLAQYYLPCSSSEHKEKKTMWPLSLGILNAFSFHSSSLWEQAL